MADSLLAAGRGRSPGEGRVLSTSGKHIKSATFDDYVTVNGRPALRWTLTTRSATTCTAFWNTRTSHHASYQTNSFIKDGRIALIMMKLLLVIRDALALCRADRCLAQDEPPPEPRSDFRYSFSAIDDATFDSNLRPPLPASANMLKDPSVTLLQNQLLLEPLSLFAIALAGVLHRAWWAWPRLSRPLRRGLRSAAGTQPPLPLHWRALEPYTGTHTQLRVKETYARPLRRETSTSRSAAESCAGAPAMPSLRPAFLIRRAFPPTQPTA